MGKYKQQEQPDRHLEAPAEANRDKHINFLKEEEKNNRQKDDSLFAADNRSLDEQDSARSGKRERDSNRNK